MKLKNDIVNLIVRVEHHLCPQYCGRPPTRYRLSTSDDKRADYHTLSYYALSAGERTLWFKPLWLAYIRVLPPAVPDLETEDSFREGYFFSLPSDVRQTGS